MHNKYFESKLHMLTSIFNLWSHANLTKKKHQKKTHTVSGPGLIDVFPLFQQGPADAVFTTCALVVYQTSEGPYVAWRTY